MKYFLKSIEEINGKKVLGVEQVPSLLEQLFGKKFDSGKYYREGEFWYSYPQDEKCSHKSGLILRQVEHQILFFEIYEAIHKRDKLETKPGFLDSLF